MVAQELIDRGHELAVQSILVTYHCDGSVVVAAYGEPWIDLPDVLFTGRGRTADVAAKRVLTQLTRKRRLARINQDREGVTE